MDAAQTAGFTLNRKREGPIQGPVQSVVSPIILVDGEPVTFDGPAPDTARTTLELIAAALESQGRVLTLCSIDGHPVAAEGAWLDTRFERMELETEPVGENGRRLAERAAQAAHELTGGRRR